MDFEISITILLKYLFQKPLINILQIASPLGIYIINHYFKLSSIYCELFNIFSY